MWRKAQRQTIFWEGVDDLPPRPLPCFPGSPIRYEISAVRGSQPDGGRAYWSIPQADDKVLVTEQRMPTVSISVVGREEELHMLRQILVLKPAEEEEGRPLPSPVGRRKLPAEKLSWRFGPPLPGQDDPYQTGQGESRDPQYQMQVLHRRRPRPAQSRSQPGLMQGLGSPR